MISIFSLTMPRKISLVLLVSTALFVLCGCESKVERKILIEGSEYSEQHVYDHVYSVLGTRDGKRHPNEVLDRWSVNHGPYACGYMWLNDGMAEIVNKIMSDLTRRLVPFEVKKCVPFVELDLNDLTGIFVFAYKHNFDDLNEWMPWHRLGYSKMYRFSPERIKRFNEGGGTSLIITEDYGGQHIAVAINLGALPPILADGSLNQPAFIGSVLEGAYAMLSGGGAATIRESVKYPGINQRQRLSILDELVLKYLYELPEGIKVHDAVERITERLMVTLAKPAMKM